MSSGRSGPDANGNGSGLQTRKENTMNHAMTTTAFTIDGYRIKKSYGVVRGITVRSARFLARSAGRSKRSLGGIYRSSPNSARKAGRKRST